MIFKKSQELRFYLNKTIKKKQNLVNKKYTSWKNNILLKLQSTIRYKIENIIKRDTINHITLPIMDQMLNYLQSQKQI